MTEDQWSALVCGGALAVGGFLMWRSLRSLRGTTLVHPWGWTLVSLVSVAAAELFAALALVAGELAVVIRFVAAISTLCPAVSLLGAKRPQDRAWNLIVLSLWAVAAWPAARLVVLPGEQTLALHTAQRWFVVILIGVGLANLLPTRYWFSALLAGSGQIVLLIGVLPLLGPRHPWHAAVGMSLIVAALGVARWFSGRSRSQHDDLHPLDRIWFDFRDSFGVLWALRVAERVTASAQQHQWDLVLTWTGFRRQDGTAVFTADSEPQPDRDEILRQVLDNLLRRFVSQAWIKQRLPDPSPSDSRE